MTQNDPHSVRLFHDVVDILVAVTDEGPEWASAIAPYSRLESDLRMESLEFAAFGDALRARYGHRIDLGAHLASLELDELIGLSVADVIGYVASRQLAGNGAAANSAAAE